MTDINQLNEWAKTATLAEKEKYLRGQREKMHKAGIPVCDVDRLIKKVTNH